MEVLLYRSSIQNCEASFNHIRVTRNEIDKLEWGSAVHDDWANNASESELE